MIKQNQAYLNRLHIFIDAVFIYRLFCHIRSASNGERIRGSLSYFSLWESTNWDFHTIRRRLLLQSLSFFYYILFSACIPQKDISAEAVKL